MVCALTVRKLKPDTFDDFREAFMRGANPDDSPDKWVRFDMVRNHEDPNEVICFGFFDGSADELRSSAQESGYADQMEAIAPYVESVGADGLYEVVEEWDARTAAAG
jgi:hypothetical protein